MDKTSDFYSDNMGSIPVSRTILGALILRKYTHQDWGLSVIGKWR